MAHDRQPRQAALVRSGAGAGVWVLVALTVASPHSARGQARVAPDTLAALLPRVVSDAHRFSTPTGVPPVFEAYAPGSSGEERLVGYAFLTSDFPPEQMGFNGPIEVLVGMDLDAALTGVLVTRYVESHRATRGDFLAEPGFQGQFAGKSVLDAFQVRRDVDGISGATITVDAMSRGIRNAAREVARTRGLVGLSAEIRAPRLDPVAIPLEELEALSWRELLVRGMAQRITVLEGARSIAELSLAYARDRAVADALLGPETIAEALERAGPSLEGRHLVLAGVDGQSAGALNLARLSVVQGGDTVPVGAEAVFLFGPPEAGKLEGQVRMARVLLLDPSVDMGSPFTWLLDLRPGLDAFTAAYPGSPTRTGSPLRPGLLLAALSVLVAVWAVRRWRRAAPRAG